MVLNTSSVADRLHSSRLHFIGGGIGWNGVQSQSFAMQITFKGNHSLPNVCWLNFAQFFQIFFLLRLQIFFFWFRNIWRADGSFRLHHFRQPKIYIHIFCFFQNHKTESLTEWIALIEDIVQPFFPVQGEPQLSPLFTPSCHIWWQQPHIHVPTRVKCFSIGSGHQAITCNIGFLNKKAGNSSKAREKKRHGNSCTKTTTAQQKKIKK